MGVVYSGALHGAFVLDDEASVVGNRTIRTLARWPGAFAPPGDGTTVQGRPLLNFSFALNWAAGGPDAWGYHALNVGIHVAAALLLYGIIRRTLGRWDLAAATAGLWALHPLCTEAVTYIAQRAESLMGMFYLLTLYAFIRGCVEGGIAGRPGGAPSAPMLPGVCRPRGGGGAVWLALSYLACLCGMATKEVMATAPVMVLFYDRTFVAGSFGQAWRRRRGYYAALASTWLPLAALAFPAGSRAGTVGARGPLDEWRYLLSQAEAVVLYLRLCVWPHPLVFDYGPVAVRLADAWPAVVAAGAFAAAAIWALASRTPAWRRVGFLGAWFLGILAPTLLVPNLRQTFAEHRLYLPLAAVVAGFVLAVDAGVRSVGSNPARRGAAFAAGVAAAACALAALTAGRNRAYATATGLYADTVARRPGNAYAHNEYGFALARAGRPAAAETQFREALALQPGLADAHYNLGVTLANRGDAAGAIAEYDAALAAKPDDVRVLCNLAIALAQAGRIGAAEGRFAEAVRLHPDVPEAQAGLGDVLLAEGRAREAVERFRAALRLRPDFAPALEGLRRAASLPSQ